MGNVRIRLNSAAVRDLLRSQEVQDDLLRRGEAIARAANAAADAEDGHAAHAYVGRNRARVEVATVSAKAMVKEATDRTLTASIDAGAE